jgi:hypothetical protein
MASIQNHVSALPKYALDRSVKTDHVTYANRIRYCPVELEEVLAADKDNGRRNQSQYNLHTSCIPIANAIYVDDSKSEHYEQKYSIDNIPDRKYYKPATSC